MDLFVTDMLDNRVRRVVRRTSNVEFFAGSGKAGFAGNCFTRTQILKPYTLDHGDHGRGKILNWQSVEQRPKPSFLGYKSSKRKLQPCPSQPPLQILDF